MGTSWAKEDPFPGQTPWLTNLIVRAFARDWVTPFGDLPAPLVIQASDAAADAGIPPKWLLDLNSAGVPPSVEVAHAVVQVAIAMGPPANTLWDTLMNWKANVLNYVCEAVQHGR